MNASATIVNLYIPDVSKLAIFANHPDPTKNQQNQKLSCITNIANDHREWECMINRREPLTYAMVDYVYSQVYSNTILANAGLDTALAKWLILEIQTGTRNLNGARTDTILEDWLIKS